VVPETVTGGEGSAKRNIVRRKSGDAKARKEGIPVGAIVDDGSLYTDGPALDRQDPNYDSEEDSGRPYMPFEAALRAGVASSKMNLTAYKKAIEPLISAFFVHGEFEELLQSLQELDAPAYSYEFVKRCINQSLDKGDRERELTSQLLSYGYPNVFSSNCIGKGFERLFELVDEIEIDVPTAREMLSTYLARAVVDEVLPPSFLSDAVVCNLGGEVVKQAKLMLSREHGGAKLERVWGPGDGRPVEDMKVAVDQLLQEYMVSGDLDEACRCIMELNQTQFYHEIVKRAVVNALDVSKENQLKISELLAYLVERDRLTSMQAIKGFNRLHSLVGDLSLDTPTAGTIIAEFTSRAIEDNVLPKTYKYVSPPESMRAAAN
jgi:programmed cell death protein 4